MSEETSMRAFVLSIRQKLNYLNHYTSSESIRLGWDGDPKEVLEMLHETDNDLSNAIRSFPRPKDPSK